MRTVAQSASETNAPARTLLVGTALTVKQLVHVLPYADPTPEIKGCLLPIAAVDAMHHPGCTVMGDFEALDELLSDELLSDELLSGDQRNFDQVILCLPQAMNAQQQTMADCIARAGIPCHILPAINDQLAGTSHRTTNYAATPDGTQIDPALLIKRQPRPLHESTIRDCVTHKTVLITGAGGSIGSELARIVARFQPDQLILVERSENGLFEIDREIARIHPDLTRHAILHDITDRDATDRMVAKHRPDMILHAAAHKHVPMMENHPSAAIENNFFGTRSIADAALAHGCSRFVMISTDKAVNPSSVMGASKRLAELYIQHLNAISSKKAATFDLASQAKFSMVRFGNVLGSACSVLPIWSRQLREGGPITVTDERMTRYFMTIPEAAGLVLQAAALSRGGEVFLLDMGEPVKILELAERFVKLNGYEPHVDMPIAITGIRPGEKLFEELAYGAEDMRPTDHQSIRIWKTAAPSIAQMSQVVNTFDRLRSPQTSRTAIHAALRAAVPEMVTAATA